MATRRQRISLAFARITEKLNELKTLVDNAGGGSSILVAGYRCTTAQNINTSNTGVNINWDNTTDRRQDTGISIDASHQNITVSGTPNHVELNVNLKISIDNLVNIQRPNQVIKIIRSDGRVIASSATGYIRDASDHEESSYNISAIDFSPIQDASYRVVSYREATSGVVSLDVDESQITLRVYS